MNVSFICCVYRRHDYERYVLPIVSQLSDDIVEVASSKSIFEAYNRGTFMAKHQVKVYIHDDAELLDPTHFAWQLKLAFADETIGMVGPIGSRTLDVIPWWHNEIVGCVSHGLGKSVHDFGNPIDGMEEVAALDGMLFATNIDIWWPEEHYGGFHLYDMEAGEAVKRAGKRLVAMPIPVWHHHHRKGRGQLPDYYQQSDTFSRRHQIPFSDKDYNHIDWDKVAKKEGIAGLSQMEKTEAHVG